MPSPHRTLTLDTVHDVVRGGCFAPEARPRIGVELELLTFDPDDPLARVRPDRLAPGLPTLPDRLAGGSSVTFEPGGQLELSSAPFASVEAAWRALEADLATATQGAAGAGVRLVGLGADPHRPPRRVVGGPRYDAMEAYFDAHSPAGRTMMCNTAAVQVNVGVGPGAEDAARQWRIAHHVGPTLAAAFANSPLVDARPSGFRSSRLATWLATDRSRAAPVVDGFGRPSPDAWVRYALDARVMLVRRDARCFVAVRTPLSLREWVVGGHELGFPTLDDLQYHLGTLFPPVRPRGWLELRMIDAQERRWWPVPAAVVAALLWDPEAGAEARAAAAPVAAHSWSAAGASPPAGSSTSAGWGSWAQAARLGLGHPGLAASARRCFRAALAGLERLGTAAELVARVAEFGDRYVERGRCPADDRLDEWSGDHALLPTEAALQRSAP